MSLEGGKQMQRLRKRTPRNDDEEKTKKKKKEGKERKAIYKGNNRKVQEARAKIRIKNKEVKTIKNYFDFEINVQFEKWK